MLLDGALSPVNGFQDRATVAAIRSHGRLPDGLPWSIPLLLPVSKDCAAAADRQGQLALRDTEGLLVALVDVSQVWSEDGQHHVAGPVIGVENPGHHDFPELWATPLDMRERAERSGWQRIIAYPTRHVINRAEHALINAQARRLEANVLIQLEADIPQPGDVMHYARVRSLQHAVGTFLAQTVHMHLRPRLGDDDSDGLLMRLIIAQNYGCTHLVYAGAATTPELAGELGVELIRAQMPRWSPARGAFFVPPAPTAGMPEEPAVEAPDEPALLAAIEASEPINQWSTWPEVVSELRRARPPRSQQGFTLLFTGYSGSGKSTIAKTVMSKLMAIGTRRATLLDGDVVRTHLSSELGFSREHRNLNVLRIGFVAAEITKFGGIAICAPIAPYASTRAQFRAMVEAVGGYVEVHVATPLEVCEARDRKGLYAKARAGEIAEFTGISDPYDVPETPELRLDTTDLTPDAAAQQVILKLQSLGYLTSDYSNQREDYQYIM